MQLTVGTQETLRLVSGCISNGRKEETGVTGDLNLKELLSHWQDRVTGLREWNPGLNTVCLPGMRFITRLSDDGVLWASW